MELKKQFFGNNQPTFEDKMKTILDIEIQKVIESILDEQYTDEEKTMEAA
ncbi:hypothetical protein [Bacillus sp. CGMCC 1.16541]|nr:hypothetical protein [Bacillus sp. CGMCC 1.16541]